MVLTYSRFIREGWMRRREFTAGLGSAAAWPVVAVAQQPRIPIIGRINLGASSQPDSTPAAWVRGLNDTGFFVDTNVSIDNRAADGQMDRLSSLVTDLIQRKVDLIYGPAPVAIAAKADTSTIPIVFATGGDPVTGGIVASINHPGGNITGVVLRGGDEVAAKLIELVHAEDYDDWHPHRSKIP
jgi:putative ABC transport system substrate-binding protein